MEALREVSKRAVGRIVADLCDRSGLDSEWDCIDSDIKEEILEKWADIIEQEVSLILRG